MTGTRKTIREEMMQALLHRLEKDLSDQHNVSDKRVQFIPRQALLDTISHQQVVQLLKSLSAVERPGNASIDGVAMHISPQPGACHCQRKGCTGARMILATLLLIGKESLITTLFSSQNGPTICDQSLPFGNESGCVLDGRDREGYEDGSSQGSTQSPTQGHIFCADSEPAFFHGLSPSERERFAYRQWQVITPFLTSWDSKRAYVEAPAEVSLPWQAVEGVKEHGHLGRVSHVQKIKIFPGNHNLSQYVNASFALKTFYETFLYGAMEERFAKELEANRKAPQHSRIVPVLAAFKHRRRCHLILPFADGGSLEEVWSKYSPMHITPDGHSQPATWCSEPWLLSECIGIAQALAAIHGLTDDKQSGSARQIHADLKPENVLCYLSSDESGTRSLTLKLADLGEAVPAEIGAEMKASMVPHTKTYRPPEHNPLGKIGFNYDVWCLGCLYLDFITWFLLGLEGVEAFRCAREKEGDDSFIAEADGPQMIEDIYFRRVKSSRIPGISMGRRSKTAIKSGQYTTTSSLQITTSVKIEYKVKECVRSHLETLKSHRMCESSAFLKGFINYIGDKMMIVDTRERAQSNDVLTELESY